MRFLLALGFLFATAVTGLAQGCDGQDLRAGLTERERALLAGMIADVPYPEGLYWVAEREGQILHLIGTVHLDDPRLDPFLPVLQPVIEGAGMLLLEMDGAAEQKMQEALVSRPEMVTLQDTSLPELMTDEAWTMLADAARDRGIPPFLAAKFQPWYLSMILALPPCLMSQLTNMRGLDHQLMDFADAAGVPVVSLEPFDTIFSAFNAAPLDEQVNMMAMSLTTPQMSEDLLATVVGTYFDERTAEGWALSRILASRFSDVPEEELDRTFAEMNQSLLLDRNASWIAVIEQNLDKQPLVAAFGAAHLPGTGGVLHLLTEAGFDIRRQPLPR